MTYQLDDYADAVDEFMKLFGLEDREGWQRCKYYKETREVVVSIGTRPSDDDMLLVRDLLIKRFGILVEANILSIRETGDGRHAFRFHLSVGVVLESVLQRTQHNPRIAHRSPNRQNTSSVNRRTGVRLRTA